ncbi:glucose 1-dehydrogenase [Patulibacter defluvii]|uniref:glucose 1-dehydrogenase n=1 Tax=Patulibacter defluvii TaxID=3095358 RepID=UPI0035C93A0B
MEPRPAPRAEDRRGSGRLRERAVLISGGDSGIGRAVAVAVAREGADVALLYRSQEEDDDARETVRLVGEEGRTAVCVRGDVGDVGVEEQAVATAIEAFGRLDVLVNNAGEQHVQERLEDVTPEQVERTFRTNVFGMFGLTRAALPHLRAGSTIVNTTSVTAYAGHPALVDYAATKGAIVAFTRSLALQLADRGVRVNAVAPGSIWTPLIPATFDREHVERFGEDVPLGRPGQPQEVAECFVFLACDDSSYMTGQVLHPNGGRIVGG